MRCSRCFASLQSSSVIKMYLKFASHVLVGIQIFFGKESLGFGVERGEINNGGGGKK